MDPIVKATLSTLQASFSIIWGWGCLRATMTAQFQALAEAYPAQGEKLQEQRYQWLRDMREAEDLLQTNRPDDHYYLEDSDRISDDLKQRYLGILQLIGEADPTFDVSATYRVWCTQLDNIVSSLNIQD